MKRLLTTLTILAISGFVLSACETTTSTSNTAAHQAQSTAIEENQKRLNKNYEIPKLEKSLEIENNHRRLEFLNKSDAIGYVYLMSHGKVVTFYPIRGKVSSLNSYSTAMEQIVDESGKPCNQGGSCHGSSYNYSGYIVEAPDIDGSYGQNVEGIYFFTTEGAYVEWNGEYMYTSEPLSISTPLELTRQVN